MKERIITSIILVAIFVPLLLIGNIPFDIFVILLANIAIWELKKVHGKKYPLLVELLSYVYITLFLVFCIGNVSMDYNIGIILLSFLLFLIPTLIYQVNNKYNIGDAFSLITSELLLSFAFSLFIIYRDINLYIVIYLLSISVITDVFAYFTGKMFGKNKIAKDISPNKTIEGSIGGCLFGVIVGTIIYIFLVNRNVNIYYIVFQTLFLCIMGEVGDLIFSAIKRNYKIKDYSNILPGHGGILDRFDNIIIVMITYALIFITFR